MLTIHLKNMQFFGRHGVFDFERTNGGKFAVSITMQLYSAAVCRSDRIEDTVNYALVYDLVGKEMMQPSNLVEHVAGRISRVLFSEFPEIAACTVRVSKVKPPIQGAEMAGADAELSLTREEYEELFKED